MVRIGVLVLLLAASCGGDAPEACLTRAECSDDEICVNGECSMAPVDGAVLDVASDAVSPDASAADAGQPDSVSADAPSGCGVSGCEVALMCDMITGSCVECLLPSDCASGMCTAGACAGCDDDAACTAPEAAACNVATGMCEPCATDAECFGTVEDGTAAVCDGGFCVQCTEADDGVCGGRSCDPATNLCTSTPTQSLEACEACVSDTECRDGACIAMNFGFGGDAHGSYCLRRADLGCERGFREEISRSSVSGASPEEYCGIQENRTTCEAVLSIGRVCVSRDDCELGGWCEGFARPAICTIRCSISRDCPEIDGDQVSCDGGYCRPR